MMNVPNSLRQDHSEGCDLPDASGIAIAKGRSEKVSVDPDARIEDIKSSRGTTAEVSGA